MVLNVGSEGWNSRPSFLQGTKWPYQALPILFIVIAKLFLVIWCSDKNLKIAVGGGTERRKWLKQRKESTPTVLHKMQGSSKWALGAYYLRNTLNQRIGPCGILELSVTFQNNTVHTLHFKIWERIERLNDMITVTRIVALWGYLSLFIGEKSRPFASEIWQKG